MGNVLIEIKLKNRSRTKRPSKLIQATASKHAGTVHSESEARKSYEKNGPDIRYLKL